MNTEPRPLYLPHRYVLPQRVSFLPRFGLKAGVDFAYFGLNRVPKCDVIKNEICEIMGFVKLF